MVSSKTVIILFPFLREPDNKLGISITLIGNPEYSHDNHKLIRLIDVGDLIVFQMDLDLPSYNTRKILFLVRQHI